MTNNDENNTRVADASSRYSGYKKETFMVDWKPISANTLGRVVTGWVHPLTGEAHWGGGDTPHCIQPPSTVHYKWSSTAELVHRTPGKMRCAASWRAPDPKM